jgi:hypothetical protein
MIAEQKGVSVQDLALRSPVEVQQVATAKDISPVQDNTEPVIDQAKTTSTDVTGPQVLTDEEMAKKYRSDADRLSKEAAQLRRLAEELVPTKKKVAVKE